jgi:hypothetical protein
MHRLTKDVISAVVLVIISGVVLWETSGLNEMSAVFPRTIGYILLVLSLFYLVKSIAKPTYEKVFEGTDKRKVLVMSIGVLIYAVLIWIIGFLVASLCYLFSIIWYLQGKQEGPKKRIFRAGIASLSVSVGFYFIFKFLLNVPLPLGILFDY